MNARTLTASILVALLAVLTLASAAGAACAWVLWNKSVTTNHWTSDAGYESKADCDGAMKAVFSNAQRQGGAVSQERGVPTMRWRNTRTQWFCLPDTVDPRGPNGGGR